MRILTYLRQVLDAEESVHVANGALALENSKLVMDTMDEYGVEEALRLRESGVEAEIIAVAVGPARVQDALRTALAMGVDRAIHIETDTRLDAIALSKVLAQIATQEEATLIFSGGQQADWDSHALGAATAERLHWPQATWTSALELKGTTLTGKHDADEGSETFTLDLPAVITTQQGLNEPRYPTLPNIMKSKKKELRKESLDQFSVSPKLKFVSAEIQVKNRINKILDGKDAPTAAAQLVELLRNEARVIA
ncbi:MAG TPA: electron transfer flavoprotein subunit beta/FixA family protein [Edaphobacter sp.]|jgi:electron transfer flavoprotein beta subunit|nr:electron transfer flavoprotein subunit beta/FixA family protein [Edaphobacter sp.]